MAFLQAQSGLAATDATGIAADHSGASFEPTLWYAIDREGVVTVHIIRAEMGQHVGTALARIVADELEVDWTSVRLHYADTDPKWGTMVTGGSWSVWQSFPQLSQAGAAGRIALIEEGAKLMRVLPATCTARNGVVRSAGKSVTYADIVRNGQLSRSYSAEELKALPIKPAGQRRLIGLPTAAIDIPSKTTGAARYGLDARVPGMVYARPKLPPTRNGCKVTSVDDSAALVIPGYLKSLVLDDPSGTVPGWVVVCADSFFAASRAADLVKVEWTTSPAVAVSEADIQARGLALVTDAAGGSLVVEDAGVDVAFSSAWSTLERKYTTATVLHFQLEPLNALALHKDGVWEIHTGNQWQSLILPTLAKALGVAETQVVMRTYLLGGGFGRRLNGDYAVPAALAAKALGRPVKLLWARADDVRFDSPRSPSVQRLRMAFNANGHVTAMQHHASAGWPTQVMVPSFMPKGRNGEPYDPFAISGADHWYSVGAQRVRAISNDLANSTFRPGWLRSVGPGWTNWALESFMDEAARAAGMDPLAFRLRLLGGNGKNGRDGAARQALVLQRAADMADWGAKMPAGTGLGLATTFGQERDMPTWCACVARVSVDRSSGVVKVQKLTVVVDAGTIVHPDGALAQVEGASLWGLSMALFEGTAFANGQVRDTNLDTYTPLRMRDVPSMEIAFIPSTAPPTGLGEPATTVVGPAIGNAIFAAVGVRLRHLPIRPADVLAALKLA
ncbi:xanthine dehydrogenase family protein molybdopterin-binding subunit [Acidovorax sp. A1169]|uniref:xanthine dehydrogenase family protein molybdopterin-binding subunit n=1 Tax=Acidovorax sp. A1169 TaxID=3059524 RepID=UPI002737CC4B|nr:molybdopterin cofactor-binding domain-containing protein [Acidovorax sp. A1169]MDP4078690.1 molybdopterin-dependent oxidoreductase [Acidovorax sp. A1169]